MERPIVKCLTCNEQVDAIEHAARDVPEGSHNLAISFTLFVNVFVRTSAANEQAPQQLTAEEAAAVRSMMRGHGPFEAFKLGG